MSRLLELSALFVGSQMDWNMPEGARLRRVRVVRDYGMFDRREAPQYYPEVQRRENAT